MRQKRIMILGGNYVQAEATNTAKRLGYYVISTDMHEDNPGHSIADEYCKVDITDKEAVLHEAQRLEIDGVRPYCSDILAPVAAYVQEQMGLPGNPCDVVNIMTHKDQFRDFMRKNGFLAPRSTKVMTLDEAVSVIERAEGNHAFMMKPTDNAGSRGVFKVCNADDIKKHWGGLWYTDNGRLCQNSATLLLPIRIMGSLLDEEGQVRERNYIYLGADLLDLDEVMPVSEQIDDKLIVIGDFKSDVHSTFLGMQPGSSILFNGYIALSQGAHLVNWLYMGILFVIYIIIGLFYLSGHSFSSMCANPWLSIVLSFLSTATVFLIIALIASWYDIAFNMWVPTTVYSLYDTFMQKYNIYKNKAK